MNNFSELVREERPDYKVYNSGFDSLNSVELISLIIGQGKSTHAAMQQARQIVNICGGSLRDIATRRAEELQVVQGVDPKKAMTLQAAFELAKRIEREALVNNATTLTLIHNHPSGNPCPSRDDDRITATLKQACSTMRLYLIDHVVVTDSTYYSYSEEGKL